MASYWLRTCAFTSLAVLNAPAICRRLRKKDIVNSSIISREVLRMKLIVNSIDTSSRISRAVLAIILQSVLLMAACVIFLDQMTACPVLILLEQICLN